MNHVERFRSVLNFQPVDRLPRWEWSMWWDQTIQRWHGEGLPRELQFSQVFEIARYSGLDPYQQFWFSTTDPTTISPEWLPVQGDFTATARSAPPRRFISRAYPPFIRLRRHLSGDSP